MCENPSALIIFFSVCFESALFISVALMVFFDTAARKWTPSSHPTWAMAWTGQYRLFGIILHDFSHFPFFVLLIRIFHLGWLVVIYLPDWGRLLENPHKPDVLLHRNCLPSWFCAIQVASTRLISGKPNWSVTILIYFERTSLNICLLAFIG